ncbi:hypothetical protein Y1Q_0001071 [Alligator mississippiensis]|uniref:Uncharacterized protein n=1 Tax=Alligator mississippiensis TaxID=8496 RepID=A0A151NEI9_ALLMI|nr:hypothetical protein Y1Q_0001071 [Alligator mississippiensis]
MVSMEREEELEDGFRGEEAESLDHVSNHPDIDLEKIIGKNFREEQVAEPAFQQLDIRVKITQLHSSHYELTGWTYINKWNNSADPVLNVNGIQTGYHPGPLYNR